MKPLQIKDLAASALADYVLRDRRGLLGVVVHRIQVSQEDNAYGDTPAEISRFFMEHPIGLKATGGKMPYPLLIEASGALTQVVPLLRVTPHARAFNPTTIGLACIGDFRHHPPTAPQRETLVLTAAALLGALGLAPQQLFGHDELEGASADPTKECPGRHLSMAVLRDDVAKELQGDAVPALPFLW